MPVYRRRCALLVLLRVVSVVVVLVQIFFDKIPLPVKLPGDTHIRRESTEFSFPIAMSDGPSLKVSGSEWLMICFSNK